MKKTSYNPKVTRAAMNLEIERRQKKARENALADRNMRRRAIALAEIAVEQYYREKTPSSYAMRAQAALEEATAFAEGRAHPAAWRDGRDANLRAIMQSALLAIRNHPEADKCPKLFAWYAARCARDAWTGVQAISLVVACLRAAHAVCVEENRPLASNVAGGA